MSPSPNPTTLIESRNTQTATAARELSAVRWVFPENLVTKLAGAHRLGRCAGCDECAHREGSNDRTIMNGSMISRHHARIEFDGPIVVIRDTDSANGLFINGQRRAQAPLRIGDVIRCGEWVGVLVAEPEEQAFGEVAEGWFGGATLANLVAPLKKIAHDIPVIIQGETGTGKEGLARAIHTWSSRGGPFVGFNCAAIPESLAESELFGYAKGAHSLAQRESPGLFRTAHRGTVFLDEVLDLSLPVQSKLLRVLEMGEVLPLGSHQPMPIDVRVIVAAQESVCAAAHDGRIRLDLYARLDGLVVQLPPLRDRREDIVPLFSRLWLDRTGGHRPTFDGKFAELLSTYDWPLNVRELVLLVRRLASIHGPGAQLKRSHLPERMLPLLRQQSGESEAPEAEPVKRVWRKLDDEEEFDALVAALRQNDGNVSRAAKSIGMDRNRANRLLAAHSEFSVQELRSGG